MSDVKRYKLVHDSEYQSQMLVRPDGKYVTYDDYAALEARLEVVTEERDAKIDPDYVQGLVDLAEPMLSDALSAAEAETARLTVALAAVEAERDQWISHTRNAVMTDSEELQLVTAEVARLTDQLATARRDALEECHAIATEALTGDADGRDIYARIDALIAQEEPKT